MNGFVLRALQGIVGSAASKPALATSGTKQDCSKMRTRHYIANNYQRSTWALLGTCAALAIVLVTLLMAKPVAMEQMPWPQNPAADHIGDFQSEVRLHEDGRLTVTEMIRLRSATAVSNKGIRRYLPKRHSLSDENILLAHYAPLQIWRRNETGRFEDFAHHREQTEDYDKFYLGNKAVSLSPGEYTYWFQYEVSSVVQKPTTADQIVLDLTGAYWNIPIRTVEMRAMLDPGISNKHVSLEAQRYVMDPQREQSLQIVKTVPLTAWHVHAGRQAIAHRITSPIFPREGLRLILNIDKP